MLSNDDGTTTVVEGEKIVGETPCINPGESFSYNSYHVTHLSATASGSFHGSDEYGETIHVRLSPFRLEIPEDPVVSEENPLHEVHRPESTVASGQTVAAGNWSLSYCNRLGHIKICRSGFSSLSHFQKNSLDFIVLTHCHLDHLGSLPLLSREHPDAPVLLSYPSSILARRMLSNSSL